ncbi:MAG: hypothetical protein AB7K09_04275 [Planctomycetota bacterium]
MNGDPAISPGSAHPELNETPEQRMMRAGHVLGGLRKRIVESMVDHILENDDVLDEFNPDDRYNYWLIEIEEKFLAKLGLIRRVTTEIQSLPGMAPSLRSRVHHARVPSGEPLGVAITTAIEQLGQVTIVDIAIHDDETGHDVFIVYQVAMRGPATKKPVSK